MVHDCYKEMFIKLKGNWELKYKKKKKYESRHQNVY